MAGSRRGGAFFGAATFVDGRVGRGGGISGTAEAKFCCPGIAILLSKDSGSGLEGSVSTRLRSPSSPSKRGSKEASDLLSESAVGGGMSGFSDFIGGALARVVVSFVVVSEDVAPTE